MFAKKCYSTFKIIKKSKKKMVQNQKCNSVEGTTGMSRGMGIKIFGNWNDIIYGWLQYKNAKTRIYFSFKNTMNLMKEEDTLSFFKRAFFLPYTSCLNPTLKLNPIHWKFWYNPSQKLRFRLWICKNGVNLNWSPTKKPILKNKTLGFK